jgi:hypothetical protein
MSVLELIERLAFLAAHGAAHSTVLFMNYAPTDIPRGMGVNVLEVNREAPSGNVVLSEYKKGGD